MRGGAALTWMILTLVVWALRLPPSASSTTTTFSTTLASLRRAPHTPLFHASSSRGAQLIPEDDEIDTKGQHSFSSVTPIVEEKEYKNEEYFRMITTSSTSDLLVNTSVTLLFSPLGDRLQLPNDVSQHLAKRSTSPLLSTSFSTVNTSSSTSINATTHRSRHHHAAAPLWLRPYLQTNLSASKHNDSRHFEEKIAAVFHDVVYGSSTSYRSTPLRRQDTRKVQASPRVERTTPVDEQQLEYPGDASSGREKAARNESVASLLSQAEGGEDKLGEKRNKAVDSYGFETSNATEPEEREFLGLHEYDSESYDLYEGHYTDFFDHRSPEVFGAGNESSGATSLWKTPLEHVFNWTETPLFTTSATPVISTTPATTTTVSFIKTTPTATTITTITSTPNTSIAAIVKSKSPGSHAAKLSWLDVLRCTHRGLAWVLINFFLGILLLLVSLLGPYRLLNMRYCTPLLPRTHYVALHLLVFMATSLKAVYLFHLAFGSSGRLPLVLLLLLTNTGFPCLSSAFLVLMMMMFIAADVQVYKSKLYTAHNSFMFMTVMLILAFVADVIVGCAHSRSVLVLSRVMVITVAALAVLLFIKKHQALLSVSKMMKQEFQGELKLLVRPAKGDLLQQQMDIKYILRSRLGQWCRTVWVSTIALALLSFVHLLHTIFLVSAYVPAWAWWFFHVSGCLVEALLALSTCVAAALTQRYDESISFPSSFMLSPMLMKEKGSTGSAHPVEVRATGQRVSLSNVTDSTHYSSSYPDATLASRLQTPRRRSAQVKRSATFSHTPQVPHTATRVYGSVTGPLHVMRSGSASNLPLCSPSVRCGIYRSNVAPRGLYDGPIGDASVLVHEDGFVRVRTSLDICKEAPRPHGSLIMLQQAHFQSSSPYLLGAAGREIPSGSNSPYQSLSRRRKRSRGDSDILRNNIDVSESEYQSSSSSRQSYGRHCNLPSPHKSTRIEADYRSLSRCGRRGYHTEGDNNNDRHLPRWRSGHRELPDTHLNNLDYSERDYPILAHRQISREDNNDPVHQHHCHSNPGDYSSRSDSRDSRPSRLNVYSTQGPNVLPSTHGKSSGITQKVTNRSFSPVSPSTPPTEKASHVRASPNTKRQAKFPKPFVRIGSNMSLQEDDLYCYGDYIPRSHPVRRNHSSAGYYPSRYITPSSSSLAEEQRYSSLRLSKTRKRYPHYLFTSDGKLLNRNPEEGLTERRTRTSGDSRNSGNGPEREGEEEGAAPPRECPSRQSTSSKRSDEDWAIELIKSSSMLTDFYSLTSDQKKAKRKEKKEVEILEEQEE